MNDRSTGIYIMILLLLLMSSAVLAKDGSERIQARTFFEKGHYHQALEQFEHLSDRNPKNPKLHFWVGYSAYRLGQYSKAEEEVKEALRGDAKFVEAYYLAGLLASRNKRWSPAKKNFIKVTKLAPKSALGKSARTHLSTLRWQKRLEIALNQFQAGGWKQAARSLDKLLLIKPNDPVARYYRAYADYKMTRYNKAITGFKQLLKIHPLYDWARLMMGWSLAKLGHERKSKGIFYQLSRGNSDVAKAAKTALVELNTSRSETVQADTSNNKQKPDKSSNLSGKLNLYSEWDTNPTYLSDSSYAQNSERVLAYSIAGSLDWVTYRSRKARLALYPSVWLRAYPDGPADYDLLQTRLGMEGVLFGNSLRAWTGALVGISTLGWSLFLDSQEVYVGASWRLHSLSTSRFKASAYRRQSHNEKYDNLSAYGLNASLTQGVYGFRNISFEVGYEIRIEKADDYKSSWEGTEPEPFNAQFQANASFFGHGPSIRSAFKISSWQTEVGFQATLLWKSYSTPESIRYETDEETLDVSENRNDRQWLLNAYLKIVLFRPFFLVARYTAIFNDSTLEGGSDPSDRRYSRQIASVGLQLSL